VAAMFVDGPPQAIHVYDCMLSEQTKFCAKGDKYNLNVNISKIQLL
jgi:hypothetical protein